MGNDIYAKPFTVFLAAPDDDDENEPQAKPTLQSSRAQTIEEELVDKVVEGYEKSLAPVNDRRWGSLMGGSFFIPITTPLINSLPGGTYTVDELPNHGLVIKPMRMTKDVIYELDDPTAATILDEIIQFWNLKDNFKKYGLIHKRGILLYGIPGGGKTALINLMSEELIKKHNGIILMFRNPDLTIGGIEAIREVEPDRPIIVVMEDIDSVIHRHGERTLLALLDGEYQISNVVYMATTNYPENLSERFIDRPSRFDVVKEIGLPTYAARRSFLNKKDPTLTPEELNEWALAAEGLTIAHLKELLILCRCYGKTLEEGIARLHAMREQKLSANFETGKKEKKTGFI